jgi:hypothetical protein
MPSRDLAPLPAGDALSGPPGAGLVAGAGPTETAPPPEPAPDAQGQLPGQLAIPVPEAEEEIGEAVVVSIERAGSRRRAVADQESTLE